MEKKCYMIREIEPRDDMVVERIIRSCLIEFGADHEGTAWTDANLGRFSMVYRAPKSRYFVAEDGAGQVVGGVGIGAIPGVEGVCELQKMYCLPEARGTGAAQALMDAALSFAKEYYTQCYLETLPNMQAAQRFYEKYGFRRCGPITKTAHFACDVRYIRVLSTEGE